MCSIVKSIVKQVQLLRLAGKMCSIGVMIHDSFHLIQSDEHSRADNPLATFCQRLNEAFSCIYNSGLFMA